MDDLEARLREALAQVARGRLSRRAFVQACSRLGLSAPLAASMLGTAGAQTGRSGGAPFAYRPTRRGGGGVLRILSWQAPTLLNQHFSSGAKDVLAARLFYEPLAAYDIDGSLHPVLIAEVPTLDNGGVARDGLWVTCRLKRGVSWHDGEPFTADDVVFTCEFLAHAEAAAFTSGSVQGVKARKLDAHTVRFDFATPRPAWADLFVLQVLPKKHFAAYTGSRSREAPGNLRPVGTGPYRLVEFRPGDLVRGEANPAYHMPNRPHFDAVEIKGGGDSLSAARSVLQTGDYDVAWMIAAEDDLLRRLESGGRGRLEYAPGGDTEYIMLNHADPWSEVDGERSSPRSRHPFLLDPAVRQALAHVIDRDSIQRYVMGRSAVPTPNFLNNPAPFNSVRRGLPFDPARAAALLEAAGWTRGRDGVRAKGAQRLKMVFHTSTSSPRQKVQAIVKSAAQTAGIEMELKATSPAVYFSGDHGNPDTSGRFVADLQMHTVTRGGTDPGRFLELFCSWQVASRANKWLLRNITRWRSDEYDRAYRAAESELDPVRRAAMLIRLNDTICDDLAIHPLFVRHKLAALRHDIQAPISGWGAETGRIHDWYRAG
ncbi:MAG: peptide ABC transporter substrate-binding protein [Rubrivivax sp.]|nr:peptide ABC transporter substrate-binding protein [Rubrivivax sp.]